LDAQKNVKGDITPLKEEWTTTYKMVGQCCGQRLEKKSKGTEQAGGELWRKPKPTKGCNAATADGVMKYTTVCYNTSF